MDRGQDAVTAIPVASPPRTDLWTPSADITALFELGVLGVPLVQYLCWAERAGLFGFMARHAAVSTEDIVEHTLLNARGADAFLGILCSLGLATRTDGSTYVISDTASEYLDPSSPYWVGESLYGMLEPPIPARMLKGKRPRRFSETNGTLWDRIQYRRNPYQWGRPERLRIQHSRNFAPAVVAARTGAFDGVRHLVDMGGGTGVFAIPLALDRPDLRITLVEFPRSIPHIDPYLRRYGVGDRIRLVGCDLHKDESAFPDCDGILFGNFFHSNDDAECRTLLRKSFAALRPGGRLFVHEMLWGVDKTGPLLTALWNFWMISVSAGRQRTFEEFQALFAEAGFLHLRAVPTSGCFSLLTADRP